MNTKKIKDRYISIPNRLELFAEKVKEAVNKGVIVPGLSKQSMENYRKRGTIPSGKTLVTWSMILDLDINWLLLGEGEMLRSQAQESPNTDIRVAEARIAGLEKEVLALNKLVAAKDEQLADKNKIIALHENREKSGFTPANTAPSAPGAGSVVPMSPEKTEG